MVVQAVKTGKILASKQAIFELLDKYLPKIPEKSVVAITSKIVSLCEGRVISENKINKDELVKQESEYYLPASSSRYDYRFTIAQGTLTSLAGVDESNGDNNYVLWPADPQKSANEIREHLQKKHRIKEVGVVITDSTCMPMRWGTVGLALSYSGFKPIHDYIGQPDLFGRPFQVSRAGIASGLAATAVLAMGEGTEQTPLVVISDVPFVKFQNRNPNQEELGLFYMKNKGKDLFAPFFNKVEWLRGDQAKDE